MAGGKGKDNTLITCPEWGGGGKKITMMQKMVQGALNLFQNAGIQGCQICH